jgi:hypothetical protein
MIAQEVFPPQEKGVVSLWLLVTLETLWCVMGVQMTKIKNLISIG